MTEGEKSIQPEIQVQEATIQQIKKEAQKRQEDFDALEAEIEDTAREGRTLSEEKKTLYNQIKSTNLTLLDLESQNNIEDIDIIKDVKENKEELNERYVKSREQIKDLKRQIKEKKEEKLMKIKENLNKTTEELNQLKQEVIETEKEYEAYSRKHYTKRKQNIIISMKSDIREFNEEIENKEKKIEELINMYSDFSHEIGKKL